MNLLLLGAGASKSYSESPTGLRMPIANDFFNTFQNLDICENPFVIIGAIVNYIETVKKTSASEYFSGKNNIEELHTEVERNLLKKNVHENPAEYFIPLKANNELVYLFASVINEIQNGNISKPHCHLSNLLSPQDTIITFNWDTLMDRALSSCTEWTTDYGYWVTPKMIYRDCWQSPSVGKKSNHPKLLKLHGYTNWITSHPIIGNDKDNNPILSQASSPDTFYVYESTIKPYPAYEARYMHGYEPFSYGYYPPNIPDKGKSAGKDRMIVKFTQRTPFRPKLNGDNSGLISMPLIIPPVKQKSYDMFGELFTNLWDEAQRSIATADSITIIGYSFPETDIQSNELFKKAFMERTSIPRVTIIDPKPHEIANKFKYEFGIPANKLNIYDEYFSEDFDTKKIFYS